MFILYKSCVTKGNVTKYLASVYFSTFVDTINRYTLFYKLLNCYASGSMYEIKKKCIFEYET